MKIIQYLKNPYKFVVFLGNRGRLRWMKDQTFLKLRYRAMLGKKLNLDNPKTYTEKLQWMKLYDRQDRYTDLVDKAKVKEYVSAIIGEEYIIPTLGIWDRVEDIRLEDLPERFVLKCTHDSGGMVICRSKADLDWEQAKSKLKHAWGKKFYWENREWAYKNVTPRIIAEPYLEDSRTGELRDYKFFCFQGEPKMMYVASDRLKPGEPTKFDFFDLDYQHLEIVNGHPHAAVVPQKPEYFEQMKELATKLSKGMSHVRVDLYEVNGRIYFGEFTFYHCSGMLPFTPEKWDRVLGDWLILPREQV